VVASYDLEASGRSEPDMGLRAAQWAAALVRNEPVKTGPICTGRRIEGGSIVVEFSNVGGGLMVGQARAGKPVQPDSGKPLGGFQVAGQDKKWHDAKAAIKGDTVVVTCDKVEQPAAVRYAWAPEPTDANLYNRDGFPALPFESARPATDR
jgi:sialate O-acetylesterase